jgi:hypothetical protein
MFADLQSPTRPSFNPSATTRQPHPHLFLLQPLAKPSHGRILPSRHGIPLLRNLRTPSNQARMLHTREMLIIERHPILLQRLPRMLLQLRWIGFIELRSLNLHRRSRIIDILLRQQARMASDHTVRETLELASSKSEAHPSAVAVSNVPDFLVFTA